MNKDFFSTTAKIVNGIWDLGTGVYQVVSDDISNAVDEEALRRTHRYFGDAVDEHSATFRSRYRVERKTVAREYKAVAVKGGLLALGLGLFF